MFVFSIRFQQHPETILGYRATGLLWASVTSYMGGWLTVENFTQLYLANYGNYFFHESAVKSSDIPDRKKFQSILFFKYFSDKIVFYLNLLDKSKYMYLVLLLK